jgi:nitrogen fixation/metabolism regulation signal transduction histidine kinase
VGAELFHAGRQTEKNRVTDMTKLIVAFRNFAKAPKTKKVRNDLHVTATFTQRVRLKRPRENHHDFVSMQRLYETCEKNCRLVGTQLFKKTGIICIVAGDKNLP